MYTSDLLQSLIEPDLPPSPERNLISAILLRAIQDLSIPPTAKNSHNIKANALDYLTDPSPQFLSAHYYCSLLSIDYSQLLTSISHLLPK